MKNILIVALLGALLGSISFAWFSPDLISWYFSPPAEIAFSCKPAVEWGISVFRKVIFTGMLLSSLSSTLLYFAFQKRNKARSDGAPQI